MASGTVPLLSSKPLACKVALIVARICWEQQVLPEQMAKNGARVGQTAAPEVEPRELLEQPHIESAS